MKYRFSQEQYEEIKAAREKCRDKQTNRRLEVLEMRCEGNSLKVIAAETELCQSHVSDLIRLYFEEGLDAVATTHYAGNRRNMSIQQENAFLERYRPAFEAGEKLDFEEMKAAYEQEVGHRTGQGQIYKLLVRHGWLKVTPYRGCQKKREEKEKEKQS